MVRYISNIYVGIYTVLVGMVITFRQMFKPHVTHQYPYQYEFERKDNYREIPTGYRGQLHNRVEDCIVCNKCAQICPVDCIYIDSRKPSGGRGAKLWESMNVVHLKDRKQVIGIVEGNTKKIIPFRKAYLCSKLRIITADNKNPIRTVTFRKNLETRIPPNRKPGRPIYKWANRALIKLWEQIQIDLPTHRHTNLNLNNVQIRQIIHQYSAENP